MNEAISQAKEKIEREDYDAAVRLLQPLAEAGDTEAQFLIGHLYFTSANVSKHDSRVWLQRAAAGDHPESLYYLASLGDEYDFGPPEDDADGLLLLRAAELGSVQAQRDLGCFYATGDYVFPKDEALGRLWYGRAAAQGHADAQFNYGCMLLYGEGGPVDRATARDFIHRAAAQGDQHAINFIQDCASEIA